MAEWRKVANSERPEISPADQADRRFRAAERKAAREEREREEAAQVRDWLERRNYEENYHRGEPVGGTPTTAKAESVSDEWADWNRWCDRRIERYMASVETRIEKMVQRRVEESMVEVYKEMSELATGVHKAIQAIGQALDKQADVIREMSKRGDDVRSSDNQRPLRVVN
jgi:hypothetical protein